MSERFVDDSHSSARVAKKELIFMRPQQCADWNRNRANFDGPEKAIRKFGNVRKQQQYPLLHAHAQSLPQARAEAIHSLAQLCVSDPLISTFDRHIVSAAFLQVAVHKKFGGIELWLIFTGGGRHGRKV